MRRGEVWWVDFDPAVGGEIRKRRPAVIVSNDSGDRFLNRVQVVPLSSNTSKLYPSEARVRIGETESKAMADQLTTADKSRLIERLGALENAVRVLVRHFSIFCIYPVGWAVPPSGDGIGGHSPPYEFDSEK